MAKGNGSEDDIRASGSGEDPEGEGTHEESDLASSEAVQVLIAIRGILDEQVAYSQYSRKTLTWVLIAIAGALAVLLIFPFAASIFLRDRGEALVELFSQPYLYAVIAVVSVSAIYALSGMRARFSESAVTRLTNVIARSIGAGESTSQGK